MKRAAVLIALVWAAQGTARADQSRPLLLRHPTVNQTHVVFVYGDDLWCVPRGGGEARRLTSGVGIHSDPVFSPDGTRIAYTAEYDGNQDVYVMPADGGAARRLTYHPGPDQVVGWTPDGKRILFRSRRASYSRFTRLYTVPVEGGFPTEVPLPMAYEGSYAPDGQHIAYVPIPPAFQIWKRYRGGRTTPVWVADLSDSHVDKVPRDNSNDFNPMWLGDKIYFLSDRNGPFSLFSYDPASREVTPVVRNEGLDIKSASAGAGTIVYEQFGTLHLLDPRSGRDERLSVRVPADLATLRPHFEKVVRRIEHAVLSPHGARAAFEARGEILTVPADKGDIRNVTQTPGVAERDPAWSPDGKWLAYFSDESGEYQLHVRDPRGTGEVKKLALGDPPSFYSGPVWSPDAKRIVYTDQRLHLWCLELATGKNTVMDTDLYAGPNFDPAWSPDSQWVAYTKQLDNSMHAVFVYSFQAGKAHQVTDGMSDARYPAFDKNGKYLYFTASTDIGPTGGGWEMSGIGRSPTRSVYAAVLRADLPSPVAPESDEDQAESAKAEKSDKADKGDKKATAVRLDLEGIGQRIVALPLPAQNYLGLTAGKEGVLFVLEGAADLEDGPPHGTLHRFDLAKRKAEKFLDDAAAVDVSHDGEKLLYRQGEGWFIVGTGAPPKAGDGALKLDALEVRVDPKAEWRQMYREVWRIERDFLYDPGAHGLDLAAAEKKYAPYIEGLASRRDLNYLFAEMLGNLTLGHVYILPGNTPPEGPKAKNGLLGADLTIAHGRYRVARVYNGENWNPQLRAPLTQPGVDVKPGEYLLAVNGRDLRPPENLFARLEGTAGKSVLLKVGPNPDGQGAREVTVVPIDDEGPLRNLAWIEDNRRKVDRLTGGRVAYVYVTDTAQAGFRSFVRYFYAQLGRDAAVIDERFNAGGVVADFIVDTLRRPRIATVTTRAGRDVPVPREAIPGPKVMIINEFAGSGGDELPHYFRQARVGKLVGKRTWGGLVGIDEYPTLIGGGVVTAPSAAFWFPSGQWEVENHGVAPDVEIEFDPKEVRAGHDPQLEKAVALAMEELRKHPVSHPQRPAYPNYYKSASKGSSAAGAGGKR